MARQEDGGDGDDDGHVVSPVSSRRSFPSPAPNNPFASASLFGRGGYHRMPAEGAHEMATLHDGLGISMTSADRRSSLPHKPVGSPASPPLDTRRAFHGLLEDPAAMASNSAYLSPASPPAAMAYDSKRQATAASWDVPPSEGQNPYLAAAGIRDGAPPADGTQHGRGTPGNLDPGPDFAYEEYDDEVFYKKFAEPPSYCWSKKDITQTRRSWLSITIYVLSLYSTIMSGIWLVTSILQPRWGYGISSKYGLLPSTATIIAALAAKTIEMSFVTVFISCIGQVLTRRAFRKKSQGMTLAEMTMRNWVIQPGSLITHCETLPYAAITILGALSLTATIAAAFYTTASDAMVSPKLKYGDWESKELSGYVRASYANAGYVRIACPSLFDEADDIHADESCMNVQFSGQSYRNLLGFLSTWTNINQNGTMIVDNMAQRPPGTMLLYDNTTMVASWIETEHSNVTAHFEETGRIINNVTLAMPHPGVYAAATSKVNKILQPDDLAGVGEYAIRAGVVSPSINVMCVNMDEEELAPLIYTTWPNSRNKETGVGKQVVGRDGWDGDVPQPVNSKGKENWLNRTVVDDIFRWGPKHKRRPPVFSLYPSDYNILTNGTMLGSDSVYMLGKTEGFANYTLCELRSWTSPNCSTGFNISGTGGASMKAHCEDPEDEDSYLRSFDKDQGWSEPSLDWRWLGLQFSLSMDLNGGTANANASNARILTQLALQKPKLPSHFPSFAEALAVYASSSIVISSMETPFRHYWDFDEPGNIVPAPGILQVFNASIMTQEYTSGHVNTWQAIFYVVLVLVFAINMFCLFYFVMHRGLVTDFTEPQNLFALSVNSPPSAQLKGSCGGGPHQRDLVVPWRVAYVSSANHYFFEEANEAPWRGKYASTPVVSTSTARDYGEVRGTSYKRLSTSRGWL